MEEDKKDQHIDDACELMDTLYSIIPVYASSYITDAIRKDLKEQYGGERCCVFDDTEWTGYAYEYPLDIIWIKDFEVKFIEPDDAGSLGDFEVVIISEEGKRYEYNLRSLCILPCSYFDGEIEKYLAGEWDSEEDDFEDEEV